MLIKLLYIDSIKKTYFSIFYPPPILQIKVRAKMVIADVKEHCHCLKSNPTFECLHVAISFVIGAKKVNGDWVFLNL